MFVFYFNFLIPIKNQPLVIFIEPFKRGSRQCNKLRKRCERKINIGNKTLFTDDMIVSAESSEEYTRKANRTSK